MKINQSTVAMASERQAVSGFASQVTTGERVRVPNGWIGAGQNPQAGETAATLEISGKKEERRDAFVSLRENLEKQTDALRAKNGQKKDPWETPEYDFKIKMMLRLLESLRAFREGRAPDYAQFEKKEKQSLGFSFQNSVESTMSFNWTGQSTAGGSRVTVGNTHWEERVTMSSIFTEREATVFSSKGSVETADGRKIEFNLNFEMSREFTQATNMEYTRKIFCVDPLVINLDGSPASFSDQTFFFDLDGDGREEELSNLKKGSGFLALDKNRDGKINDGNELFGTKSGDGFKDLAAYDEDKNGWIDESDSVFDDLKIWTLDENGNSRLLSLKEAGVGALYLGNVGTEFSLKEQGTNRTQGIVRSTGVFLKENGEAGTIQHVDYAV